MSFRNPDAATIENLLRQARTIAVVGLSANPARPSFGVARSLQRFGYRVIPVNPAEGEILGERCWPTLDAAVSSLKPGERIDIVDVFRRPEHVAAIADDCIRLKLPVLWLQDGVIDAAAAARAQAAGVVTIMDRSIYRDRALFS
jgi:predicted CoA-binding protein